MTKYSNSKNPIFGPFLGQNTTWVSDTSTLNENFACANQLIVMIPIQAVKLPTMTVTRLPSLFE